MRRWSGFTPTLGLSLSRLPDVGLKDWVSSLRDLLTGVEVRGGFVAGLIALVVVATVLRRYWGLVWAATGVVTLQVVGGPVFERAVDTANSSAWVAPALAAGSLLGAKGLATAPATMAAPGFALTAAGIWATVPDTEGISVLLGITAALIWLWWPLRLTAPTPLGGWAATILLGVAAAAASPGRPGALVGSLGVLASLAVLGAHPRLSPIVAHVTHLALIVVWSQLAGRAPTGTTALTWGASLSAGAIIVAMGLRTRKGAEPETGRARDEE